MIDRTTKYQFDKRPKTRLIITKSERTKTIPWAWKLARFTAKILIRGKSFSFVLFMVFQLKLLCEILTKCTKLETSNTLWWASEITEQKQKRTTEHRIFFLRASKCYLLDSFYVFGHHCVQFISYFVSISLFFSCVLFMFRTKKKRQNVHTHANSMRYGVLPAHWHHTQL